LGRETLPVADAAMGWKVESDHDVIVIPKI
jgi:hypothetical protein